jgi:hypothetical protein
MPPLASLLPRTLLLALLLGWAAPSFAGTKLDLSPHLGGLGMPGDFKVFVRSDGGQRTLTVLQVEPWKKGWKEIVEEVVTGTADSDGTLLAEAYLIPGKLLLGGNESHSSGLAIVFRKPVKGLKLRVTPGKLQRTRQKGRLLVDGVEVATARLAGEWTTDGFETVTTPSGTYADALRAQARSVVTFEDRKAGLELVQRSELTLWYAVGRGLVKKTTALQVYENGALLATDSWVEELSAGSSGGVSFP